MAEMLNFAFLGDLTLGLKTQSILTSMCDLATLERLGVPKMPRKLDIKQVSKGCSTGICKGVKTYS